MSQPTVSFVVPCYKLAHLLTECVRSILAQDFSDFEILIMDDCSPDATGDVARSFQDDRIQYVRNDQNLGHLRNYNKGISLSRGQYVWLISADDYLRRPRVLGEYVRLMDSNPNVGYVFCAGVGVTDGNETELLANSFYRKDTLIKGRAFLKQLLRYNFILAPSVMVRRQCYTRISDFPLTHEMAWSGDWYLWCTFALHYDVAYFVEPMVCYRIHDGSMTSILTTREKVKQCSDGDLAVPWMIHRQALNLGLHDVAQACLASVAREYRRQAFAKQYRFATSSMSIAEFEDSLSHSPASIDERSWIRAHFYEGLADRAYAQSDRSQARQFYLMSLRNHLGRFSVYAKLALLCLGAFGNWVRSSFGFSRTAPRRTLQ